MRNFHNPRGLKIEFFAAVAERVSIPLKNILKSPVYYDESV